MAGDQKFTEIFSWGCDSQGQLGLGLMQTFDAREGDNKGELYPIPRFCTYGIIIREISCGEEHSAFITNENYLYTMGSNRNG